MEFRRLLPSPGPVDELELLATLRERPAPAGRPYVAVNFVASVDGHSSLGGRSGPLGDDGDRAMFHGLREQFDAVLAGTGTLRVERYGRLIARPERRERRVAAGRPAEPLACIVTRSGELPADLPLLAEPEARVAIFSPVDLAAQPSWRANVEVVRLPDGEALRWALSALRADHGITSLLCEGGPTLFAALLAEDLVDELFLTVAPTLTAGAGSPITAGPELPAPAGLDLVWLLERAGSLYARYAVHRDEASATD